MHTFINYQTQQIKHKVIINKSPAIKQWQSQNYKIRVHKLFSIALWWFGLFTFELCSRVVGICEVCDFWQYTSGYILLITYTCIYRHINIHMRAFCCCCRQLMQLARNLLALKKSKKKKLFKLFISFWLLLLSNLLLDT